MHLTVLVPDLVWPEPGDTQTLANLPCPSLEWLLAHGTCIRGPRQDGESALASCFGLAGDPPFAPLRLLGEPLPAFAHNAREGFWLCADPVHLRFHHERIVLADAGAFSLSDDEAHSLAIALNREFADMGEFHVATPRRWYLRLTAAVAHAALPLSVVAGRRVNGELPTENAPSPLRRWLNEVQMFLHGHPVNDARQAKGEPSVNSLWLWGAGTLPGVETRFSSVWADTPLALGLARAARLPARELPDSLAGLLADAESGKSPLVVLDALQARVLYEDGDGWRAALTDLEAQWFAPLRTALGQQLDGITLVAPTIYGHLAWEIGAGERWKFWRRSRPLATLAKELAA